MEIEGKQVRELIFHWIKSDQRLQTTLRGIQIKMLIERIVQQMSYHQMGQIYKAHPVKVRQIFEALLMRIEKKISKPIADLFRSMDKSSTPDKRQKGQHYFEFSRIYLN